MKLPTAQSVLLFLGLVAVAFVIGWCAKPAGLDPGEVAELKRAAGDSAVASFRRDVQDVTTELRDSVRYYRGEALAGVRVVIRRVPVTVHDTVPMRPVPGDSLATDTVEIGMPPLTQGGVSIAETLAVAPRPRFLGRRLGLTFDTDTLVAALLRTPDGLQRFTAIGTRAGLEVRTVDAAVVDPGRPNRGRVAVGVATATGCGMAGWGLGEKKEVAALAGAAVCVGGFVLERPLRSLARALGLP